MGTHTDITARKHAETALREREEKLRTILVASPDPMVKYDTDGMPQYVNPAFTDVFGWSLDELRGKRIPFVPEDQLKKLPQKLGKYMRRGTPPDLRPNALPKRVVSWMSSSVRR